MTVTAKAQLRSAIRYLKESNKGSADPKALALACIERALDSLLSDDDKNSARLNGDDNLQDKGKVAECGNTSATSNQ